MQNPSKGEALREDAGCVVRAQGWRGLSARERRRDGRGGAEQAMVPRQRAGFCTSLQLAALFCRTRSGLFWGLRREFTMERRRPLGEGEQRLGAVPGA